MALRKSVVALAAAAFLSVSAVQSDAGVVSPAPASSGAAAGIASGIFGLAVGWVIFQSMLASKKNGAKRKHHRPR